MRLLHRAIGPVMTNVYVLGDEASREAIAIDTARPCAAWLTGELAAQGWTLKLIVSSHGHWDHIGDNAELQAHTGAEIAVPLFITTGEKVKVDTRDGNYLGRVN